jgi:MoaA/NifB/PqqE/SkfB family radical SAM enzyme
MWRSVRNYFSHALPGASRRWDPLLAVYYLTYACDFRCPYCSDGAQNPYYELRSKVLPPDRVLELLRRLRRACDNVVITGGEPLKYPRLDEVLHGVPALGFDGVVFTTNGHDLEPHLEAVASAVRYLVFSLDTLDHGRADACFGVGPGARARILENIDRAEALVGRGALREIIISAVATPDNLDDLRELYGWSKRRGFRFALCPQLQGVHPNPALRGNQAYYELFDYLLAEKRSGGPVNGSPKYLEYMRDLRKFACRPFTTVAVAPEGGVFYPCLELGQEAGNLLEEPDLARIRAAGEARFGPQPRCDNRCQSACALGFSLILNNPLSMVPEIWHNAQSVLRRR